MAQRAEFLSLTGERRSSVLVSYFLFALLQQVRTLLASCGSASRSFGPADFAVRRQSLKSLEERNYRWSDSSLGSELSREPEAKVLGVDGAEPCCRGWLKGF